MAWQVLLHREVQEWFFELDEESKRKFTMAIRDLRANGPTLGRPLVDHIKGSQVANLKELRLLGTSIRCLFVFDRDRRAIVLVAGDKKGQWKEWYRAALPLAEERYFQLLRNKSGESYE